MTGVELAAFFQLLDVSFRGELTEPAEAAIARVFGRVPWSLAERTVDRLVYQGQVFVPVPAELVRALWVVAGGEFAAKAALAGESPRERAGQLTAEWQQGRRPMRLLGAPDDPAPDVGSSA